MVRGTIVASLIGLLVVTFVISGVRYYLDYERVADELDIVATEYESRGIGVGTWAAIGTLRSRYDKSGYSDYQFSVGRGYEMTFFGDRLKFIDRNATVLMEMSYAHPDHPSVRMFCFAFKLKSSEYAKKQDYSRWGSEIETYHKYTGGDIKCAAAKQKFTEGLYAVEEYIHNGVVYKWRDSLVKAMNGSNAVSLTE